MLQADSDISANKRVDANNVTCPPDSIEDFAQATRKDIQMKRLIN